LSAFNLLQLSSGDHFRRMSGSEIDQSNAVPHQQFYQVSSCFANTAQGLYSYETHCKGTLLKSFEALVVFHRCSIFRRIFKSVQIQLTDFESLIAMRLILKINSTVRI